ncbi:hypothetical protein [uncultured Bifidobacterium sp.]|uniref:hypothetical protein n=1 Tax=uncultured Bifidobacterium sp. TaxID=165187 RepID=UPI0025836247|nr:hypothetical protein [uncultured Bifidobacterium sp.]
MNDEIEEKRSGSHGLVILGVVVVLAMLGAAGVYVYHAKQQEALASCRQSVAEFSAARKAILDTSDNSSELQKVLRDVLGVDDILDAFADAATSAEGTVDVEGCKANATITQLNLVSKTLDSATDSLNGSLKTIEKNQQSQSGGDTSDGTSNSTQSNDGTSQNKSDDNAESLEDSKLALQESLDKANALIDKLGNDDNLTLIGRKLLSALSKAVDAGQQLIDNSGVKESKYYKAAKTTLDEAIEMADNWVNQQAAKAQ